MVQFEVMYMRFVLIYLLPHLVLSIVVAQEYGRRNLVDGSQTKPKRVFGRIVEHPAFCSSEYTR